MELLDLSQTDLAREVGITQPAIYALLTRNKTGTRHLHVLARVLRTTPAYLEGKVDDPDEGAPPPPPESRPRVLFEVVMPEEAALTRMFEVLLAGISEGTSSSEQARLLAQRLPIGLAHLQELRPGSSSPARLRGAASDRAESPRPDFERTR